MSETLSSVDLSALTEELLTTARSSRSGRATHVFRAVKGGALSQILLALAKGGTLSEHENPGEALLHVLRGRVELVAGSAAWELGANEHIVIPQERHSLLAQEESAVLLTVVKASA
ncbi:MAG: cupin domain-containing protein [Microbacterium gubbeenense]|uniref:cupin domain-containing protein n=1 Tax=Microbacterium gubbeenense TaxID=159896 RepID=UPI000400AC55|nr:cupin domain-containing protein [Microbacterium gubbeenense]